MLYWVMDRRYMEIVNPEMFAEIVGYEGKIESVRERQARKGHVLPSYSRLMGAPAEGTHKHLTKLGLRLQYHTPTWLGGVT